MVIPAALAAPLAKIQDTNAICPPVVSQHAAVGCLEAGPAYFRPQIEELQEVRQLLLASLTDPKFTDVWRVWPCDGAFYLILQLLRCPLPDMEVVTRLVREYRVAVLPGSTFGLADGCYFRISFGPLKRDTAAEGLQRPGCAHCLVTMLVSTPDGWHIETPHLWTRVLVW
eukprot:EG_transcript_10325